MPMLDELVSHLPRVDDLLCKRPVIPAFGRG